MKFFVAVAAAVGALMLAPTLAMAQEGESSGSVDDGGQAQVDTTVTDDAAGDDANHTGGGGGSGWLQSSAAWGYYQCPDGWQAGYRVQPILSLPGYVGDDGRTYDLYTVICWRGPSDDVGYQWDYHQELAYDPVAEAIATRDRLLAELTARVQAPTPEIATSPPVDGTHLVGLWAWFWVEPESYETQADTATDAAGLTITLTATPGELRFFPGDEAVTGIGAIVTCEGPGLAWRRGLEDTDTDCRHFWDWPSKHDPSGQFTTRAEADYDFTWTASGTLAAFLPAATGSLGTTTVTSPDTPVTVIEVQAVIG